MLVMYSTRCVIPSGDGNGSVKNIDDCPSKTSHQLTMMLLHVITDVFGCSIPSGKQT